MFSTAAVFSAGLGPLLDRYRYPAELLILSGDLRFLSSPELSEVERKGVNSRINSALGGLIWLNREWAIVSGEDLQTEAIQNLISLWDLRDYSAMKQILMLLQKTAPLRSTIFQGQRATKSSQKNAQELHDTLCGVCHVHNYGVFHHLPAYDLWKISSRMSEGEFLARLLNGVRGTASNALANPLTVPDIQGLMWLYLSRAKE